MQGFIQQTLTLPPRLAGASASPRGAAVATAAGAVRTTAGARATAGVGAAAAAGAEPPAAPAVSSLSSVVVDGSCSFAD